jgi:uncharacterized RDD family membrane protein YckC
VSADPKTGLSSSLPGLRVVSGAEEGSPYPKCSLLLRGMARLADVAIALGIWKLANGAGTVAALLYLLLADGLLQGQSPGKRIFGIKVVHLPTRAPARYRESMLRNAPFGLCLLLGMIPQPLGTVAFAGGVAVIGGIEAWKVVRDPLGLRLGDAWAFTQVTDGKVVAGAAEMSGSAQAIRAPGQLRELPSDGEFSGRGNRCASP